MENDLTTVWNLRDDVSLLWRRLGDDYVVFNAASGQTHVPHPLSEWILREIESSPVTLGSLANHLAREAGLEQDLAISRVREALAEFNNLGLVEPG